MVERIRRQPGVFRVSKPGIDVGTARDADLLISILARNGQIIKRGFEPAPTPTNVATAQGIGTFTFNISFPAQSTKPEFRCDPITGTGSEQRNLSNQYTAGDTTTMTVAFNTSSVQVVFRGSTALSGLIYAVYRKRVDS